MELTFVSSNPGKVREVRAVLSEYDIPVRWSRQTLPEIQADELESVVRSKLDGVWRGTGYVLVEDSGLFIPGLRGFPGVYSAYVYRSIGLKGVLTLARGRSRAAVFRTVAGLRTGGRQRFFRGETRGTLASEPRGRHGFGYDPIFIPEAASRTFAEMSPWEKNQISHRARALRQVGAFLSGK